MTYKKYITTKIELDKQISEILLQKYNVYAKPGQKCNCPRCGHFSLAVKKDGSLAKCFHSSCGFFTVSNGDTDSSVVSILSQILQPIFFDFHTELLKQKDQEDENAYKYLLEKRRIEAEVIEDSALGAIPDGLYDLDKKFSPVIDGVESKLKSVNEAKPSGYRKQLEGLQETIAFLKEAKKKLVQCLNGHAGWLAFFYSDAYHRFTGIRFRKPSSKIFMYFKPHPDIAGVFGLQLFGDNEKTGHLPSSYENTITVEGEFNQLQLQSLLVRCAKGQRIDPKSAYVNCCAVGGVKNADINTICKISKRPIICYDNDEDQAGLELIKALQEKTSLEAFTTPYINSDLDSFIRGFNNDVDLAIINVRKLISERKFYAQSRKGIKEKIESLRNSEGSGKNQIKPFKVRERVAEIIINHLKDRGQFYKCKNRAYVLLNEENLVINLEQDTLVAEFLLDEYGIVQTDTLYKAALKMLCLEALKHGEERRVFTFSHYDSENNILYVHDFDKTVFKITEGGVTTIKNGEEEALFIHERKWKKLEITKPEGTSNLLDDIFFSSISFDEELLTSAARKQLLRMWIYSIFFLEIFPTRPILAVIGPKGSGKTTILKLIGKLIFGETFNVMPLSHDIKDLDAAVTTDPYVGIDNADSDVNGLEDRLAVIATGGSLKRRALYTTNTMVEYEIIAFVGITSRTPHFRREDVADRLLRFPVSRFPEFNPEHNIEAQINNNRDKIMSEIIYRHLPNVLKALKAGQDKTHKSKFRMADFADFALKIADASGEFEDINAALENMAREQTNFAIEDDPLIELLEIMVKEDSKNPTGAVSYTTAGLCNKLNRLAAENSIDCPYKNAMSLAGRIRNIRSSLEEIFLIEDAIKGGRFRHFKFSFKDEK